MFLKGLAAYQSQQRREQGDARLASDEQLTPYVDA